MVGFVLVSGGDNGRSDGGKPQAQATPREKQRATPTPHGREDGDAHSHTDADSHAHPDGDGDHAPTSGPDLARARQLQLAGFNARRSGDYETGLNSSAAALKACGDAHALDPCGYALFEVGADLNAPGARQRGDPVPPAAPRRVRRQQQR